MSEHDDALLEEELVSLPDINNDYESEADSDKEFVTMDITQSNKINIKVEDQSEDVLDLRIFDAFEEFEEEQIKNVDINNINHLKNDFYIKDEKLEDNSDEDEPITLYIKDEQFEDNSVEDKPITLYIKDEQLEDNSDEDKPIILYKSENTQLKKQESLSSEISLRSNNDLCSKVSELYYQNEFVGNNQFAANKTKRINDWPSPHKYEFMSRDRDCTMYKPDRFYYANSGAVQCPPNNFPMAQSIQKSYSFQTPEVNFHSHNISPYFYEPIYNPPNQPHFSLNQNVCHCEMHYSQVPAPSYYQPNKTFFINQTLPINQPILSMNQISPLHPALPVQIVPFNEPSPINQMLPIDQTVRRSYIPDERCFFPSSNIQVMRNENTIYNYPQTVASCVPTYENNNFSQSVPNPYYETNLNGHKILVNRNFRKHQMNNEGNMMCNINEFQKSLKEDTHPIENWRSYEHLKNDDPYLYFSDVWQEKKMDKFVNERFTSPNTFFIDSASSNEYKFEQQSKTNYKDKRSTISNQKRCSSNSKTSQREENDKLIYEKCNNVSIRNKRNYNFRKRSKQKILNRLGEKIDRNNNVKIIKFKSELKSKDIDKKVNEVVVKKEEDMDPEMQDYCKKIQEQNRLRQKFLQEKEERRRMVAMEKLGIKQEQEFNATTDIEVKKIKTEPVET